MENVYLRYKIQFYSFIVFFILSCISMIIFIDNSNFSIAESITFVDKKTDTQNSRNNHQNLQNDGHKNHGHMIQSTSHIGYQKQHSKECQGSQVNQINQYKYINESYTKYQNKYLNGNENRENGKNIKIHNFIEHVEKTHTDGADNPTTNKSSKSKNSSRSNKNAKNIKKTHKTHSNDSKNGGTYYELLNNEIQKASQDQNALLAQKKNSPHLPQSPHPSHQHHSLSPSQLHQAIQKTPTSHESPAKSHKQSQEQKNSNSTQIQQTRQTQKTSIQPPQSITTQQKKTSPQLTHHSQQIASSNTGNTGNIGITNNTIISNLYIKNGKTNELQKEIRKIFKTQEAIPQWVIKSINENSPRNAQKSNLYTLQYSKSSNSAIIHIEESNFYIEVQAHGKKLLFTKKMFETKKITKILSVNGNALSLLQQAEVPLKDAKSILNVLKNICKIKDIYSNSIRAKIYIKFNIIYDSIKNTTIKNISKISIENENYSYSIYGFRNSIKNGTYYNKDGICLVWNNISLPMKTFTLNSNYGRRLHPVLKVYKFHHGVDFVGPKYSKIYAICYGKVIKKQKIGTFGNCVFIQNPETKKTFIYAHMNSFAPNIEVGMFIEMNQPIGTIGNTGRTTGEHLHLEIRNSHGESENPTEIFEHLGKKLKGERLSEFLSSIN